MPPTFAIIALRRGGLGRKALGTSDGLGVG
jgi:hypothetical protein